MHANDILKYGDKTLMNTLDGLPQSTWETGGVCGIWSVKDIIAHLASYEQMLSEIFNGLLGKNSPTPTLDSLLSNPPDEFNRIQVSARQGLSIAEVLKEYSDTHAQNLASMEQIPLETRRQAGVLAWYGDAYDLEDFLVYSFYAHKREHSAQINVFKDSLKV